MLLEISLVSCLQINTITHKPKILFLGMRIKKKDLKFTKGKSVLTSYYKSRIITRIAGNGPGIAVDSFEPDWTD